MKKIIYMFIILFLLITPSLGVNAEDKLTKNSKSAVLMEASTGEIIYSKDENDRRFPASMTKIMSLKVIFDSYATGAFKMDDIITTSEYASSMGGSQIFLSVGEQMKASDLIKSIAIASANDACVAMAEHLYGSEAEFVYQMNEEVKKLGLTNTHFENVTGLPIDNHYTSASDIAIIARELINNYGNLILPITSKYDDYIREGTEKQFWLVNTNKLVKFVDGVDGLKTGWTVEAGYCLTATIFKNDIRFIAVSMGAESAQKRNNDVVNMLNYGVSNYELVPVVKKGEIVKTIEDIKTIPNVYHLVTTKEVSILKKKNSKLGEITKIVENKTLKVFIDDKLYQEVELETLEETEKANFLDIIINLLKQFFLS